MGNIGGEMFRLLGPFDLGRRLAHDPYLDPQRADALNVELVSLETIFSESDFVITNCPLTEETRGFINARLFALMKPSAYFINTARGPIVNQEDLVTALQAGAIAGAGLDVVEPEPLPLDHPLIEMENVILSPHALAWTDDLYEMNGTIACESLLAVFRGDLPAFPVNREVIERPGFRQKLDGPGSPVARVWCVTCVGERRLLKATAETIFPRRASKRREEHRSQTGLSLREGAGQPHFARAISCSAICQRALVTYGNSFAFESYAALGPFVPSMLQPP